MNYFVQKQLLKDALYLLMFLNINNGMNHIMDIHLHQQKNHKRKLKVNQLQKLLHQLKQQMIKKLLMKKNKRNDKRKEYQTHQLKNNLMLVVYLHVFHHAQVNQDVLMDIFLKVKSQNFIKRRSVKRKVKKLHKLTYLFIIKEQKEYYPIYIIIKQL